MKSNNFKMVNYGEFYQLNISTLADLKALNVTHEAFWVATSAPTHNLNCCPEFITILDSDNKGRILSSDLKKQVTYLLKNFKEDTEIGLDYISIADLSGEGISEFTDGITEILKNLTLDKHAPLTIADISNEKLILCNGNI
ncbi:MAG: hypothetical protein HRT88_22800, partial [Lentisphaeraceae bacterium]|nr:hypothetical protein [Lentisphaeraceae bacterium]